MRTEENSSPNMVIDKSIIYCLTYDGKQEANLSLYGEDETLSIKLFMRENRIWITNQKEVLFECNDYEIYYETKEYVALKDTKGTQVPYVVYKKENGQLYYFIELHPFEEEIIRGSNFVKEKVPFVGITQKSELVFCSFTLKEIVLLKRNCKEITEVRLLLGKVAYIAAGIYCYLVSPIYKSSDIDSHRMYCSKVEVLSKNMLELKNVEAIVLFNIALWCQVYQITQDGKNYSVTTESSNNVRENYHIGYQDDGVESRFQTVCIITEEGEILLKPKICGHFRESKSKEGYVFNGYRERGKFYTVMQNYIFLYEGTEVCKKKILEEDSLKTFSCSEKYLQLGDDLYYKDEEQQYKDENYWHILNGVQDWIANKEIACAKRENEIIIFSFGKMIKKVENVKKVWIHAENQINVIQVQEGRREKLIKYYCIEGKMFRTNSWKGRKIAKQCEKVTE